MDKLGWFKLLNIREPDVEKMAHVEGLQKMVRAMKAMGNEADGIMANRFCKSILTTEEFLGAIKKIVIGWLYFDKNDFNKNFYFIVKMYSRIFAKKKIQYKFPIKRY